MTVQRTTITLPADLLETAKVVAFHRRMSVSELVREGLQGIIYDQPKKQKAQPKQKKTGLEQFVGRRSLGINHFEREMAYEDYLRKKVSA